MRHFDSLSINIQNTASRLSCTLPKLHFVNPSVWIRALVDDRAWPRQAVVLSRNKHQENPTHLLAMNYLQPWPLSTVPARGYGDHHHQEAMVLDWARAVQGCQLRHQSCDPLYPRGKAEAWSTEDNLAKNCGSRTEEHEPQLRHHPEAGQWQIGAEELCCCPLCQLSWRVVMKWMNEQKELCWTDNFSYCGLVVNSVNWVCNYDG